jgi:flavin-dependent dehydrogenase
VTHDVAIVGAGPAGLALAIEAASRGFSAVVLERRTLPIDKACGEGLMPSGARALEALGVRSLLSDDDCSRFDGIRYIQEDGSAAEARLPDGGGLGVRRIALSAAMAQRARVLGVDLRTQTALREHTRTGGRVQLVTESGPLEARLLVAADGLASPLRHGAGLDAGSPGPPRYGMRRHFLLPPWSQFVEIYFSATAEAYVTPVGRHRVGVAFLWEQGRLEGKVSFETLLEGFPAVAARVRGAEHDSAAMGAGPLQRRSRRQAADQLVLLGDAAGYVDALTGEGVSLAFKCAAVLGESLASVLAAGATRPALVAYEQAFRAAFRRYSWLTHGMLMIARRPWLRRRVIRWLGDHPRAFERIVRAAVA